TSRNIMRDNMLVNVSGLEGHAMPIDTNIEHLIGELKMLLQAKGLQSTWDRLGNISAAIHFLKKLKKQVALAMSASYQSTTHTNPNTDHLVWIVADHIHNEKLHVYRENRPGNAKVVPTLDILDIGEEKLKSSSLATFNRKVCAMVEGRRYDEEQDSLPQFALATATNLEDSEVADPEEENES
ncbi:hypothetical protein BYT27DRAFT_7090248, partial [Phlegmacium glaucopus]